ncbi:uncharacterized protein LTR77_000711 [Saxophila tyrrhenica]|uniref:Protein-serine/threonine kinase n=1 Tax=Saxophila tyrrhenica TaxID=1690608 RepID=A0AAV9PRY1_9PEZI|nr:hypothetical protein LTR77_000711 [Saxophila tyrrhenica]
MLSLRTAARHHGVALRPDLPVHNLPLHRRLPSGTRPIQTATVKDADIARLAAKPLHPLTLADLCKNGRPPLSKQSLLSNANFTLSILPSRLAHRIQSLRSLPYIVVANPNVNKIHNNYVHSLSTLLPYAERKIETLEEEIKFTEAMADLVQTHSNTIAILAKGFLEARKYISKDEVTKFLDEHLRARIGTRLIAEQHIALHMSSKPHNDLSDQDQHKEDEDSSFIGVIDTELKPAALVRACENTVGEICELKYGVRPTVQIVGSPDATIAHIPMHIEYVLTELLKNSFRATIEAGMEKEAIEITIAPSPPPPEPAGKPSTSPEDLPIDPATNTPAAITTHDQGAVDAASSSPKPTASTSPNIRPLSHATPGVTIRIRDRGGGIDPSNLAKLWEYGFTTFNEDEIHDKTSGSGGGGMAGLDMLSGGAGQGSELAGLGYGLPLGRAYAEYFGESVGVGD